MSNQEVAVAVAAGNTAGSLRNRQSTDLPKLTTENYTSWREMVELTLYVNGWSKVVTDDAVDEAIEKPARLLILTSMDEKHRLMTRGLTTCKTTLERLQQIYADKGATNLYRMLHNYYRYSKKAEDNINVHIGKMQEMRAALADVGEKQSEALFHVTLIASLPPEYGNLLEIWEMAHPDMRTTEQLTGRLTKREEDLKKQGNTAQGNLFVASRAVPFREMTREERKKSTRCYGCGELGHFAYECPKRQDRHQRGQEVHRANVLMQVATRGGTKDTWIADTGASAHMCHDKGSFTSLTLFDRPDTVRVGDDYEVEVRGRGTVSFESKVGTKLIEGKLKNVLYIPSLAINVVSIGAAAKQGVYANFDKDTCTLKRHPDGLCVAKGKLVTNNLYALDMRPKIQRVMVVRPERSKQEWHQALGHANQAKVESLAKEPANGIVISRKKEEDCQKCGQVNCLGCVRGKGKKSSHPLRTSAREDRIGFKTHVDLSGMVNKESLGGERYYLVGKDEATDFCHVYCVRDKTSLEITRALSSLITDTEIESGERIRVIQSDCGGEFVNSRAGLLFAKEQIVHQTTAPYTAPQNGFVEREMQTITNCARTMLLESKLPKCLWGEAMKTACYLKNRLPTARSKITPFERFTKRRPSYQHLITFGTEVQVIISGHYLTKLDPRTEKGFVVGYTARQNTYRIYLEESNRILETSDIVVVGDSRVTPTMANRMADFTEEEEPRIQISLRGPANGEQVTTGATDGVHASRTSSENDLFTTGTETMTAPNSSTPAQLYSKGGKRLVVGEELVRFFDGFREEQAANEESSEVTLTAESQDDKPNPIAKKDKLEEPLEIAKENEGGENVEGPGTGLPPHQGCENSLVPEEANQRVYPEIPPHRHEETRCPILPPRSSSLGNIETTNDRLNVVMLDCAPIPTKFDEAMSGPNSTQWAQAVEIELAAHAENGTWVVVDRPKQGVTLTALWIFAIKTNNLGHVERYKARLCARGCQQRPGRDYFETFAPVPRIESIRAVLALTAAFSWHMCQFDVSTAFLNGTVEETIYLEPPPGVLVEKDKCLRLVKSLYGLKQAPRVWNSTLRETLGKLGFNPTTSDSCVYKESNGDTIVVVYVDDGLVVGPNADRCKWVIDEMNKKFVVKLLSGDQFLGMEIVRKDSYLRLTQSRYTESLLKRFNMEGTGSVSSPIVGLSDLTKEDGDSKANGPYLEAIGCLQYLATHTRPDIGFAVNFLSRFNSAPAEKHWTAVKRVLKYLSNTVSVGLEYEKGELEIKAFTDADWGSDNRDRISTSGILILMAGGPVSYAARKQPTVAHSTAEAEYIAADETVKELVYVTQLLDELKVKYDTPTLLIDNKSAAQQIRNPDTQRRSKHIDIKFHYVREMFQKKKFRMEEIATEVQAADMLTKAISGPTLEKLKSLSNVKEKRSQPERIGCMAKTAMILMTVLTLGAMVESLELQEAEPILFIPTAHKVTNGVKMSVVELAMVNPCEMPMGTNWDSHLEVKKTSYKVMGERCEQSYLEKMSPALEALGRCFTPPPKPRRVKRFDPITWAFIGVGMLIVMAVGAAVAAYKVMDTRVSTAETNLEETERKSNIMETSIADHKKEIDSLRAQVKEAQSIRSDTIRLIKELDDKIVVNRRAIEDLATLSPTMSWEASQLSQRIQEDKTSLEDLARGCRHNRMDTQALHRMVPVKELEKIEAEDTYLEEVNRLSNDTYSFKFAIDLVAHDMTIFKVIGVPHYVNLTTNPTLVEYKGAPFAAQNSSNGCIRGINQPIFSSTYVVCAEADYIDPNLNLWIPVEEEELQEKSRPAIYRLGKENVVYCMYHNITIDESAKRCPPYPFVLPLTVSFNLPGQLKHTVSDDLFLRLRGQTASLGKATLRNDTLKTDDRLLDLMETLRKRNDRSLQPWISEEGIVIPFPTGPVVSALGCILCLGLLLIGTCYSGYRRPPMVPRDGRPDQVNIYAGIAPAQLVIPTQYPQIPVYDVPTPPTAPV